MTGVVGVNILDDYHDDGIGEIQNTVAYLCNLNTRRSPKAIDVMGLSHKESEILIKTAYNILKKHFSCQIWKYKFGDEIFEIEIKNISHEARKVFLKADKGVKHPTELDIELKFFSES